MFNFHEKLRSAHESSTKVLGINARKGEEEEVLNVPHFCGTATERKQESNKSLVFGHSAVLGVTDVVSTICVRALLLMERKFVLNKSRPDF